MYRPEYSYQVQSRGRKSAASDSSEYVVIRRTPSGSGGMEVANYPFEDLAESVRAFLQRTEERCRLRLAAQTGETVFHEPEEDIYDVQI